MALTDDNNIWLACNATGQTDENAGLCMIKLENDFKQSCILYFGKSKHNDFVAIYDEKDKLVVAHEAAEAQFRKHDIDYSGISVIDKNCGLVSTQSFREKIGERTIALVRTGQGYIFISKTFALVENLDENVSGSYFGIMFRTLDNELKVIKQFELGNF